jgi:hypothetical protein
MFHINVGTQAFCVDSQRQGRNAESRNQKIFTKGNEGNEVWEKFCQNAEISAMALRRKNSVENAQFSWVTLRENEPNRRRFVHDLGTCFVVIKSRQRRLSRRGFIEEGSSGRLETRRPS